MCSNRSHNQGKFGVKGTGWGILLCLCLGLAIPPVVGQNPGKLLANLKGQVLHYPDATGHFVLEAKGNRGSWKWVRFDLQGLFIYPDLALSKGLQSDDPILRESMARGDIPDIYYIVPEHIKITAKARTTCIHFVTVPGGFWTNNKTTANNDMVATFTAAAPPEGQTPVLAIHDWRGNVEKAQVEGTPFFHFMFIVHSRQAAGGGAYVEMKASAELKGRYDWIHEHNIPQCPSPTYGSGESRHRFHFTSNAGALLAADIFAEGTSRVQWPIRIDVDEEIDWRELRLACNGSYPYLKPERSSGIGTWLSDTGFRLEYDLYIGPKKELDVVLEPVAADEGTWMPEPGQVREYKLTINDPDYREVEAIRFTLTDTSEHPGIATNAGNHLLYKAGECSDCDTPRRTEIWFHDTLMDGVDGVTCRVFRDYEHYNACAIDSLPDLFFWNKDGANDGFDFGPGAISENLNYTISQQITRDENIDRDEFVVQVAIKDSAASSKLSAEVKVAGVWYDAEARGATANDQRSHLLIPLDRDRDGMQDGWESRNGIDDPDCDYDRVLGGGNPGDGLSAFEEYRGVYVKGVLERLCPWDPDIFVFDYSGGLDSALEHTRKLYRKHDLFMWVLNHDEFKGDIINYQPSSHRNGLQYILAVMNWSQTPGLAMDKVEGLASHVGPPIRERNTVVVKATGAGIFDVLPRAGDNIISSLLAHELGHNLNLPHHGDKEGFRIINIDGKEDEVWVACNGGQHSGDLNCFMRYNCAEYYVNLDFVPQTVLGAWLAGGEMTKYPSSSKGNDSIICRIPQGGGCCGNADAGRGNCLEKIKVKSY